MNKLAETLADLLRDHPCVFVLSLWLLVNAIAGGKGVGIYIDNGRGFEIGGATCVMEPHGIEVPK